MALIGSVVLCAATLLKEISISSHFFAQFAAWAHSLPYGDLVTTTLVSLVNHLSWFVGVHGGHILDSYASDLFVPAGLPHVAVNRGATPAVFVSARNEASIHEAADMRPELERLVP